MYQMYRIRERDESSMAFKNNQEKQNRSLTFIKQNMRYITTGALLASLVFVLVGCMEPKNEEVSQNGVSTEAQNPSEETGADHLGEFEVDAHQDVNGLINQYYTAYAAGDVDTIASLADPLSENERGYISVFSQYVDGYQNVKCYTKQGLDAKSYLVSVYVEMKFKDVNTVAPGLDFFYVRTSEDGRLYIDNLYSQYNLKIKENALDTSIQSLINVYENGEDVLALQQDVQKKYDQAVASDQQLADMISTTLPDAIKNWAGTMTPQNTEAAEGTEKVTPEETEKVTEGTEVQVPEETEAPEKETESESKEEKKDKKEKKKKKDKTENKQEMVYTLDTVNVRAAADTESEKIGSLEKGRQIAKTGTEGDWSIVDYGGTKGYIKTEFLTTDPSEVPEEPEQTESSNEPVEGAIAEGTVIRLEESTNIRADMSETSKKIGTAYSGEKLTVIMSYAEGWTKVNWNGVTGYVKTSLLQ